MANDNGSANHLVYLLSESHYRIPVIYPKTVQSHVNALIFARISLARIQFSLVLYLFVFDRSTIFSTKQYNHRPEMLAGRPSYCSKNLIQIVLSISSCLEYLARVFFAVCRKATEPPKRTFELSFGVHCSLFHSVQEIVLSQSNYVIKIQ